MKKKTALTCDIKLDMYTLIFGVSLPRDHLVEQEVLAGWALLVQG